MDELWRCGAVELAAAIRSGETTAREAVTSILGRIDDLNPDLNALVAVDHDGAVAAAERADAALVAGAELGPLHGVPVTIKANLDVAGQPTTSGVEAFADKIAAQDAPAVRNLRHAGAIVLGRSNMPEFGIRGTTFNPLHGRTANPWDDDAAPGGSSGGAGVAAAAGFGPLHQGSDIGGSLRFPASACGAVTVKPTSNRVPAFNSTSTSERGVLSQAMSVQGIIAREAADVRLATAAMIRPDPRDPNSPPVPWLGEPLRGPITVAVAEIDPEPEPHPGIVELIERAAEHLADAGHRIVRAVAPSIDDAMRGWFSAAVTEMSVGMTPAIERFGSADIQRFLGWTVAAGEVLDRDGYLQTLGSRTALMRDWNLFLDEYPLVLTPFMVSPMFDWDFDTRGLDEVVHVIDRAKYAFGINYLGLPAGVIAMDLVEERPAGVQLVGRRYREDLICDAMEAIEHRNGVMAHRLWDRVAV
ncbi:MAG: amidase [Actinomycetota bacterium]